ncbi:MAG: hypothetical protein A3E87_00280 [Gammaproteobacteria bacterium RIFCSPHIGHO2_12_FULL_35_23]|nr:MAG: hypothetical protein A3E87_00280 [Gammaproteobacteria bacterium RIFCSPHIGHO2_12_FULL_35_23]
MQKNNYLSSYAWVVWIIAATFYAYEFFIRVSPSVMVPNLMRSFNVDAETLGILSASYYYAYAIMQVPVGVILDRFGIHKLLVLASLFVAGGSFLFANTDNLIIANLARVLMGIGSAFSFVGCLKLAANWFSIKQFSTVVGLTNTVGILGAISAQAPLATAVIYYGWRHTMFFVGIAGIVIAFLILLIIRDNPPISYLPKRTSNIKRLGMGLLTVLRCHQSWLIAVFGCLLVAPVSGFTELWSIPFLMKAHHISRPFAGMLSSIMFIGIAVGGPTHSTFSNIIGKRKPILIVGAIGALLCFSAVIYLAISNIIILVSLLFLFGFFTSSMLLCFTIAAEINPKWATGAAIGFTNMLVMTGGTIFQPLIGHILDILGRTLYNGHFVTHFTTSNYRIALSLLPICLITALILLFFINESYDRTMSLE